MADFIYTFGCILLEFVFLNSLTILRKQSLFILTFVLAHLFLIRSSMYTVAMNLYPSIDWDGPVGNFIIPIGVIIGIISITFLTEWLSYLKVGYVGEIGRKKAESKMK